jgi:signal peptidase I
MDFDFPTILVVATVITGGIWALDSWLWAPRRRNSAAALTAGGADPGSETVEKALKEPTVVEYAKSFFPVILIVLLLRSFLVEPFRIPSGSMMPTLLVGDFILVNKFTYGIRLPVANWKVFELGEPQRGDVVVFRYPKDPSVDYIKRVVGVPGDHIEYHNKVLYINGERIAQMPAGSYVATGAGLASAGTKLHVEQLGDVQHQILIDPRKPGMDGVFTVSEGEYFVMGDNRDNSNDSRFWGTVPDENLVGKAFMIWMNWDSANGGVSWSRIGEGIE